MWGDSMPRKEQFTNPYLQMEGLSPSPNLLEEMMRGWGGFTLTGGEADEGSDELERSFRLVNLYLDTKLHFKLMEQRSFRLVNPKSYVSLSKTT